MAADLKAAASAAVDAHREELRALSTAIWSNPELSSEEFAAHKLLTDFLERAGFAVERGYTGVETAFRATFGSGRPNVCVISEYDALPEIGHACGHNLIAEAGIAAGLGLKAALECQGAPKGMVTVMGTPAEEGEGGKLQLLENGAFEDIDIAMMVHPSAATFIRPIYNAIRTMKVGYFGKAAHAAAYPWEGVNALDAVVMAYTSVSVLRQQMKPTWRVHSIISKGGAKPNIIPEYAELVTFIRAPNVQELDALTAKVVLCYEAAAKATGCRVNIDQEKNIYANVQQNPVLASAFGENYANLGATGFGDVGDTYASTDMGNVSHVVPSLHPNYAVGSGKEVNHSKAFEVVVNTPEAHDSTLVVAKAMAHTAIDVLATEGVLDEVKKNFIT